ncbi:glycosyltransferase [Halorutilales archaeon Cl-col2-1]
MEFGKLIKITNFYMKKLQKSKSVEEDEVLYDDLKSKSEQEIGLGNYEKALDYLYIASSLAWSNNFMWRDHDIEALLDNIGTELLPQVSPDYQASDCSSTILFIASSLHDQGGHSELLEKWATYTSKDSFVESLNLILTNSNNTPSEYDSLRKNLNGLLDRRIELSPKDRYTTRVQKLVDYIDAIEPDRVLLFIHPNDVVAISSLARDYPDCEFIFYNHADHTFWLAHPSIDHFIEFRKSGYQLSKTYRSLQPSGIIPLTTNIHLSEVYGKFPQIPDNKSVSVSIGSFHKIKNNGQSPYLEAVDKILSENEDHHHVFVSNHHETDLEDRYLSDTSQTRFHPIGPLDNLSKIYTESDFLIQTFPVGGGMVSIEAMAFGLPIVAKQLRFPFLSAPTFLPSEYGFIAETHNDIVNYASKFINNSNDRAKAGNVLKKHFQKTYDPEVVKRNIRELLRDPDKWEYNQKIPEQTYGIENINMNEYASFRRKDFNPNAKLLSQVIKKHSSFSFSERLQILYRTYSNGEYTSRGKFIGKAIVNIVGSKYYDLSKSLHNRLSRQK